MPYPSSNTEWRVLKQTVWNGPCSIYSEQAEAVMASLVVKGLTAYDRLGWWIATPAGRALIDRPRKSIRKRKKI